MPFFLVLSPLQCVRCSARASEEPLPSAGSCCLPAETALRGISSPQFPPWGWAKAKSREAPNPITATWTSRGCVQFNRTSKKKNSSWKCCPRGAGLNPPHPSSAGHLVTQAVAILTCHIRVNWIERNVIIPWWLTVPELLWENPHAPPLHCLGTKKKPTTTTFQWF